MLQSAAVRLSRAEIDAITDALTGLYNHRYLHERLSEELHRARDLQRPLSVLFCDLDHFKGYNDANGHSAGDAVLREVAHVIEQSVRNIDIAARYGGEEFVVLLVETDRETALVVAERIRERIRAAGFTADGVPLTVSIGVAGYPDDADRREDLLEQGRLGDVPRQAPRPRPGGELRRRVRDRGPGRAEDGARQERRRRATRTSPRRRVRPSRSKYSRRACALRRPQPAASRKPASVTSPAASSWARSTPRASSTAARANHRSLSTRTTSSRRASTSRIRPSSRAGRRSSSASVASVGRRQGLRGKALQDRPGQALLLVAEDAGAGGRVAAFAGHELAGRRHVLQQEAGLRGGQGRHERGQLRRAAERPLRPRGGALGGAGEKGRAQRGQGPGGEPAGGRGRGRTRDRRQLLDLSGSHGRRQRGAGLAGAEPGGRQVVPGQAGLSPVPGERPDGAAGVAVAHRDEERRVPLARVPALRTGEKDLAAGRWWPPARASG